MGLEADKRIVLFAKPPVAGQVKTRLLGILGGKAAAELHEELVEQALQTAAQASAGRIEIELCVASAPSHPFFIACAARFGVRITRQDKGDLGERMAGAMARGLRTSGTVVLVGTDCPVLDPTDIAHAFDALVTHDVVLGPAEDGGYVLVGAKGRVHQEMFERVEWGSAKVLAQTRSRLTAIGVRWCELRTLWDVDRPEDFTRYLSWRAARHQAAGR